MTTFKQAREQNKIDQFIKEHRGEKGDLEAFNRAVASMAKTSPKAPPASPPDDCDG